MDAAFQFSTPAAMQQGSAGDQNLINRGGRQRFPMPTVTGSNLLFVHGANEVLPKLRTAVPIESQVVRHNCSQHQAMSTLLMSQLSSATKHSMDRPIRLDTPAATSVALTAGSLFNRYQDQTLANDGCADSQRPMRSQAVPMPRESISTSNSAPNCETPSEVPRRVGISAKTRRGRGTAKTGRGHGMASTGRGRGTASIGRGRGTASIGRGRGTASIGRGRGTASIGRGRESSILGRVSRSSVDSDQGRRQWREIDVDEMVGGNDDEEIYMVDDDEEDEIDQFELEEMKWRLIDLVRDRPPLWDPSDSAHADSERCENYWREISDTLAYGWDWFACSYEFKKLRDRFKRILDTLPPSGDEYEREKEKRVRWKYYEALEYLKDTFRPRKTVASWRDNSPSSIDAADAADLEGGPATSEYQPKRKRKKSASIEFLPKDVLDNFSLSCANTAKFFSSDDNAPKSARDPNEALGNWITAEIQTFPIPTQRKLRQEITAAVAKVFAEVDQSE